MGDILLWIFHYEKTMITISILCVISALTLIFYLLAQMYGIPEILRFNLL